MRSIVPLHALALSAVLSAGNSLAAQPQLVLDGMSARVFNQMLGVVDPVDVLAPDYAPYNELGVGLLIVVTVSLGAECRFASLPPSQASAIALGKVPPPQRPDYCQRPPGTLRVSLKHGDGTQESKSLALSRFAGGDDGRIHVPVLFYRKHLCSALELSATLAGSSKPVVKKIDFRCGE